MRKIMIIAAIAMSGCMASSLDRASSATNSALLDQPLEKSIKALGVPADDKMIAGRRVIIWRVGGGAETYNCQLRAMVDKDEIVRNIDIDGRIVSCDAWLKGVR